MGERPLSKDLMPGTKLRWNGRNAEGRNEFAVLQHRKMPDEDHHGIPYQPGWWCEGGGGLADYVIDAEHSQWEIIDQPGAEATRSERATMASDRDDLYAEPEGEYWRWPKWIEDIYKTTDERRLTVDNEGDWAEAAWAAWLAVKDLRDAGYVLSRAEATRSERDVT